MGLSFKPDTDDLRDAPSLTIARSLIRMGARVKAYDPVSNEVCSTMHPDVDILYCDDLIELASGCDALVLVTEWNEFKGADWQELNDVMRNKVLIDGRNALHEHDVVAGGLTYRGIGH